MYFKNKLLYFILALFIWNVLISSCASIGSPTGGPSDSIPPVLITTSPKLKALNFKGKEISLTFDEFILPDEVTEALVVSPPLSKKPTIKTKTKSLIIQFNEELKDSVTYSLDFKNSVADLNEKNPYNNLRFSFSTGNIYDSLRIAGQVVKAFNLNPLDKYLIMLYKNLHDSAVFRSKPDYIAKTDKNGLFLMDNVMPSKYHIFSVNDANNNLLYDEGAEEIAFYDSIIVPMCVYQEKIDTLAKGLDSMLISGHSKFLPEPVFLRTFTEDIFDQFVSTSKRIKRNQFVVAFNESVKDTFHINLINSEAKNWYIQEHNPEIDSLIFWITDSLVYKSDTLLAEIRYFQMDSAKQLYVKKDTLEFNFTDKEEPAKRRRRSREEQDTITRIVQFDLETNLSSSEFDLNQNIYITAPEPVAIFDSSRITLFLSGDSLKTPLNILFEKDSVEWRTYKISYKWKPNTDYTLRIDSAASTDVYGVTSKKFERKFSTREEDYYGKIGFKLTNVLCLIIVQFLKNSEEEDVIAEKKASGEETVMFDYLKPEKYKVKIIYDKNGNGKWDAGSLQDKYQPERVTYINEVKKIRSNWDKTYEWDIKPDSAFVKKIRDYELEELKKKEALEKAKKVREQRETPERQQMGRPNLGNIRNNL